MSTRRSRPTGTAASALSPTVMLAPDDQIYIQDTAQLWGAAWGECAIWGGAKAAPPG